MVRPTGSTKRGGRGGRGRGRVPRNNTRSGLTQSEEDLDDDQDNDFEPSPDEEEDEDTHQQDNIDNLRDLASFRSQAPAPKRTKTSSVELPTMENYQELGSLWGKSKAEEVLASQPKTHNRLPPNGLFEAQALQSRYNRDKTMLALALRISRSTLDKSL